MNQHISLTRRAQRTGLAALAGVALLGGAAWHTVAADAQATKAAPTKAVPAPTVTRAIPGGRESYADVVKVVAPAVVTIRVEGRAKLSPTQFGENEEDLFRRFFGDPSQRGNRGQAPQLRQAPRQRGLGSGVIVSDDGYILTNNHVVDGADDIKVELSDGRTLTGKLVGSDKLSDLAVVKVTASSLPVLSLANSDEVQVGDLALAVGNPLGIGQTVTMGIISAKSRSTPSGDGGYEDFIQTDAPINHGNSGGALVNTKGELIGINSQILSGTGENIGIGFAIPANMARNVMNQLRTNGKVTRSRLGVVIQPVTSDIAASLGLKDVHGAIVSQVEPGSAADHAGIKQGDVLVAFNGQPVRDTNTLRNRVAESTPGSNATVVVARDGSEKTLTVKLEELSPEKNARRDDSDQTPDDNAALGVAVAPLTAELADRFKLPRNTKGVVVQEVNPNGRAADAGLQPGDVIQQVNRQTVESVEELRTAVRRNADKPALLLISREGRSIFVTVRPNA